MCSFLNLIQVEMWMQTLPKMAAEVAAPISQCEKITMIMDMNDAPGEGSGPSKMTQEVISIMTQEVISIMTQEVISIMTKIPDSVAISTGVNLRLKSA